MPKRTDEGDKPHKCDSHKCKHRSKCAHAGMRLVLIR